MIPLLFMLEQPFAVRDILGEIKGVQWTHNWGLYQVDFTPSFRENQPFVHREDILNFASSG